jgi:ornithine carbamoyltransferase
VLDLAAELKARRTTHAARRPAAVAMIFDKPTLRTQVSFAAGIAELGGNPMLVDGALAGIGVARVRRGRRPGCSAARPAIVWRTYAQADLERWPSTPACRSSTRSPTSSTRASCSPTCSTVREHKGELAGLTVAFVGDGACNMGNSWLLAGAPRACTSGRRARRLPADAERGRGAARSRADTAARRRLEPTRSRRSTGADVVVTDTWVSMGKEEEAAAAASLRAVRADRRAPRPRQAGRDRHALPAGLPGQGDRRRGHRRPPERRLGRGGEPPARPEGVLTWLLEET